MSRSAKFRRLPASPFISPAQPIGALVSGTLGGIMAKRGFADGDILSNWHIIAGADIARISQPEKMVWPRRDQVAGDGGDEQGEGATLYLRVSGPAAIEVQHLTPQIIERVNGYFGFTAVCALRIQQAPLAAPAGDGAQLRKTPHQSDEDAHAGPELGGIKDPALADALRNLARRIKSP